MKILAISGSYRKDGPTEQAAKRILAGAVHKGWDAEFVALRDVPIEFCTNCRSCTQQPGTEPGPCVLKDAMERLLRACLEADVLVVASPLNVYQGTAILKRFLERTIPLAYWPWGAHAPVFRLKGLPKKRAVLLSSSAAPTIVVKLLLPHAMGMHKDVASAFNKKVVQKLHYGLSGARPHTVLPAKRLDEAYRLGLKLAS